MAQASRWSARFAPPAAPLTGCSRVQPLRCVLPGIAEVLNMSGILSCSEDRRHVNRDASERRSGPSRRSPIRAVTTQAIFVSHLRRAASCRPPAVGQGYEYESRGAGHSRLFSVWPCAIPRKWSCSADGKEDANGVCPCGRRLVAFAAKRATPSSARATNAPRD